MTNDHRGTVSVVAVPSPASWHQKADIVVIGSGAAGMPAAIFAGRGRPLRHFGPS